MPDTSPFDSVPIVSAPANLRVRNSGDVPRMNPSLLTDLDSVAKDLGFTIEIGTGITGHAKMTTSGNVSRHGKGDAADIDTINGVTFKSDPKRFTHLASQLQSALAARGYGSHESGNQAAALFGFDDPARGGNHKNHVHVSNKGGSLYASESQPSQTDTSPFDSVPIVSQPTPRKGSKPAVQPAPIPGVAFGSQDMAPFSQLSPVRPKTYQSRATGGMFGAPVTMTDTTPASVPAPGFETGVQPAPRFNPETKYLDVHESQTVEGALKLVRKQRLLTPAQVAIVRDYFQYEAGGSDVPTKALVRVLDGLRKGKDKNALLGNLKRDAMADPARQIYYSPTGEPTGTTVGQHRQVEQASLDQRIHENLVGPAETMGGVLSSVGQLPGAILSLPMQSATDQLGKLVGAPEGWFQDDPEMAGSRQTQEGIGALAMFALPILGAGGRGTGIAARLLGVAGPTARAATETGGIGAGAIGAGFLSSAAGEMLSSGVTKGAGNIAGGLLHSANFLDPDASTGERFIRAGNAALLLIGGVHGGIHAWKTGERALAAATVAHQLGISPLEAYRGLRALEITTAGSMDVSKLDTRSNLDSLTSVANEAPPPGFFKQVEAAYPVVAARRARGAEEVAGTPRDGYPADYSDVKAAAARALGGTEVPSVKGKKAATPKVETPNVPEPTPVPSAGPDLDVLSRLTPDDPRLDMTSDHFDQAFAEAAYQRVFGEEAAYDAVHDGIGPADLAKLRAALGGAETPKAARTKRQLKAERKKAERAKDKEINPETGLPNAYHQSDADAAILKMDPADPRIDPHSDTYDEKTARAVVKSVLGDYADGTSPRQALIEAQTKIHQDQILRLSEAEHKYDSVGEHLGAKAIVSRPGEGKYRWYRRDGVWVPDARDTQRVGMVSGADLPEHVNSMLHEYANSGYSDPDYLLLSEQDHASAIGTGKLLNIRGHQVTWDRPPPGALRVSEWATKEGSGQHSHYPVPLVQQFLSDLNIPLTRPRVAKELGLTDEELAHAIRFYTADARSGEAPARGPNAEPREAGNGDGRAGAAGGPEAPKAQAVGPLLDVPEDFDLTTPKVKAKAKPATVASGQLDLSPEHVGSKTGQLGFGETLREEPKAKQKRTDIKPGDTVAWSDGKKLHLGTLEEVDTNRSVVRMPNGDKQSVRSDLLQKQEPAKAPEAPKAHPDLPPSMAGREVWADGRKVKPIEGEKVFQVVPGFGGIPASIEGKVYKAKGGSLRVQVTDTITAVGGGAKGKTYPLDEHWTLQGDPLVKARGVRAEEAKAAKESGRQAEEEARRAALDAKVAAAIKERGHTALTDSVKVGDRVLDHFDNKVGRVTEVHPDYGPIIDNRTLGKKEADGTYRGFSVVPKAKPESAPTKGGTATQSVLLSPKYSKDPAGRTVVTLPAELWRVRRGEVINKETANAGLVARKVGTDSFGSSQYELRHEGTDKPVELVAGTKFSSPWEAHDIYRAKLHRTSVEDALKAGKPVPDEVLRDYRKLAFEYGRWDGKPISAGTKRFHELKKGDVFTQHEGVREIVYRKDSPSSGKIIVHPKEGRIGGIQKVAPSSNVDVPDPRTLPKSAGGTAEDYVRAETPKEPTKRTTTASDGTKFSGKGSVARAANHDAQMALEGKTVRGDKGPEKVLKVEYDPKLGMYRYTVQGLNEASPRTHMDIYWQRKPPMIVKTPEAEGPKGDVDNPLAFAKITDAGGEDRVVMGMDPNLINILRANLYKGDIGKVALKETIQNSVDAVRSLGSGGEVSASVDTKAKTLRVVDNGHGMLPDVVTKFFVDAGASAKQGGSSGGYGIAKVAFLVNADDFKVVTLARDESGDLIRTTLNGSGRDLVNLEKGVKVTKENLGSASGQATGTTLDVQFAPDTTMSRWEIGDFAKGFLKSHRLDAAIKMDVDGRDIGLETLAPRHKELARVETKGANLNFYGSEATERSPYVTVQVLNRGLPQFATSVYLGRDAVLPKEITVDIDAKVGTGDSEYPFTADREHLKTAVTNEIANYVKNTLALDAANAEQARYKRVLESGPEVGSLSVQAASSEHGPLRVPMRVVDTTDSLPKDLLERVARNETVGRLADAMGKIVEEIGRSLVPFDSNYEQSYLHGVAISRGDFLGLNIHPEYVYPGEARYNPILHDPFATVHEVQDAITHDLVPGSDATRYFADQVVSTLLHEVTHQQERSEGVKFTGALTRNIGRTASQIAGWGDQIRNAIGKGGYNELKGLNDEIATHENGANVLGPVGSETAGQGLPRGSAGNPEARGKPGAENGSDIRTGESGVPDAQAGAPKARPEGSGVGPPGYGSKNKIVTTEQADAARAALKDIKITSGLDPTAIPELVKLATYHVEAGAREFAEFSARMVQDLGERVKPHLQALFDHVSPSVESVKEEQAATPKVEEAKAPEPTPKESAPQKIETPEVPKPETTGLANVKQDAEALNGIISEVEKTRGKSPEGWQKAGKKAVEEGADPEFLAQQIGSGEVELTGERVGILTEGKRRLLNAVNESRAALDTAIKEGGDVKGLQTAYEGARSRLAGYLDAVQQGKGRWSDVGRALQSGTELDTGNFADVLSEFERSKGAKASPKQEGQLSKDTKEYADLESRLAERDAEIARLKAEQTVQNIGKRKPAIRMTKEELSADRQKIIAAIAKQTASVNAGVVPGINLLNKEMAGLVRDLAENLYHTGAATLDELTLAVKEHLKDILPLTDRQIHDALSGFGSETTKRQTSETTRKLNDLKTQARLISQIEDAAKGSYRKGTGPRASAEVDHLRKQLDALLKKQGLKPKPPGMSLETYKKLIGEKIAEYEAKIAAGDLTPFPTKKARALDAETTAMKAKRDMLRAKILNDIEAAKPTTLGQHLAGIARTSALSSPNTFLNLATAVASHVISAPFEELVGPIVKNTVGRIGGLSKMAGSELDFNIKAELNAVGQFFRKDTYKDVLSTALTGHDSITAQAIASGIEMPRPQPKNFILRYEQNLHGAVKTLTERNAFAREFTKELDSAKAAKLDPMDPEVRLAATAKAYLKSQMGKLQNDTMATKFMQNLLKAPPSDFLKGVAKTVVPIAKVPVVFASRTAEYSFGLPYAVTKHLYEAVTGKMTPESAAATARAYKRGSIGTALFVLAANMDAFDTDDNGDLVIDGWTVPKGLSHTPLLNPLTMGVAFRKAEGSILERFGSSAFGGARDIAQKTPFIDVPRTVAGLVGDYYNTDEQAQAKFSKGAGKLVRSIVIPQGIQWWARKQDEEGQTAKTTGFVEELKSGLPYVRQTLDTKGKRGH